MHVARAINRYHLGMDGKIAYQRWKGKPFRRDVAEFGECVMYLKSGTKGRDKFEYRWEHGVWLGVRDESGEIIVGTPDGVVKARDFKCLGSSAERWNSESIMNFCRYTMGAHPWQI